MHIVMLALMLLVTLWFVYVALAELVTDGGVDSFIMLVLCCIVLVSVFKLILKTV